MSESLSWASQACFSMGSVLGTMADGSLNANNSWMTVDPPQTEVSFSVPRRSADFVDAAGATVLDPLPGLRARELQTRGTILGTPATDRSETQLRFQGVKAELVYLGATGALRAVGSGTVREQLALKLRARDACNVAYVTWRFRDDVVLDDTTKISGNPRVSQAFDPATVNVDAAGFALNALGQRITFTKNSKSYYVTVLYEAPDLYRPDSVLYYTTRVTADMTARAFVSYPPRISVQVKANPDKTQSGGANGCGNSGYRNPDANERELSVADAAGVLVAAPGAVPSGAGSWFLEAETWDTSASASASLNNPLQVWIYQTARNDCPEGGGTAGNCFWNGFLDSGGAALAQGAPADGADFNGNAGFRTDNVKLKLRVSVYTPEYFKYAAIGTVRQGQCSAED